MTDDVTKNSDNVNRVISNNYGGTISEGQSYALLKAYWMGDRQVFERVWQWTKSNMARPNDRLLGWKWGAGDRMHPAGLIESANATDADQDIAYALMMAGTDWEKTDYVEDGIAIAQDIWRLNVEKVDGRYYLKPGTWAGFRKDGLLTVDPSYFAPYVYRTFARYDSENAAGWKQLADDIYATLESCSNLTANKVPPNWCAIPLPEKPARKTSHLAERPGKKQPDPPAKTDLKTPPENPKPKKLAKGQMVFSDVQGEGARDFGYDAFRVYWRMGMDSKLSSPAGRQKALAFLKNHPYPLEYWQKTKSLPEGFTSTGKPIGKSPSGFMAGPVLMVNHALNPKEDRALYETLLGTAYKSEGYWFNTYNDYMHSVIWLHLYALQLQ